MIMKFIKQQSVVKPKFTVFQAVKKYPRKSLKYLEFSDWYLLSIYFYWTVQTFSYVFLYPGFPNSF